MTRRKRQPTMRLVTSQDVAPTENEPAPDDAVNALLLARKGYRAAADAAGSVSLPSLTDFVD